MTLAGLVVLGLLALASVLIGAAWICTAMVYARVIRSTALPHASIWNLWSQVRKAYPSVCPRGRLLFWRSFFQLAGFGAFLVMVVALVILAIGSRIR